MIINPYSSEGAFNFYVSNLLTNRPTANYGTAFSCNALANKGSWVNLLSNSVITTNCYKLTVTFRSNATAGAARPGVADIGIDTAGGTNYVPLINDLVFASAASGSLQLGGHTYTFPIFIPAGSSIAVRGASGYFGSSVCYAYISLYGMPNNTEGLVYGLASETLGLTTGTTGTTISLGTISKSSWVSLGTTTRRWKAIQIGYGNSSSTLNEGVLKLELAYGDGTNMTVVHPYSMAYVDASENISVFQPMSDCDIPEGSTIYTRNYTYTAGGIGGTSYVTAYGVF